MPGRLRYPLRERVDRQLGGRSAHRAGPLLFRGEWQRQLVPAAGPEGRAADQCAALVNSEATKLAQLIKGSGRTLRTLFITHPPPDHFMGLQVLQREFPEAEILARAPVARRMPELFELYKAPLNRFFPGDVAQGYVTPKTLEGTTLSLEGQELKVLEYEDGESKQ